MRSAATPPNGIRINIGIEAAKLTDASASADPARVVTTQPWANCCIQVPVCEIVCPLQNSANSRFPSTCNTFRANPFCGPCPAGAPVSKSLGSVLCSVRCSERTSALPELMLYSPAFLTQPERYWATLCVC